jgi:hypothetical protein
MTSFTRRRICLSKHWLMSATSPISTKNRTAAGCGARGDGTSIEHSSRTPQPRRWDFSSVPKWSGLGFGGPPWRRPGCLGTLDFPSTCSWTCSLQTIFSDVRTLPSSWMNSVSVERVVNILGMSGWRLQPPKSSCFGS